MLAFDYSIMIRNNEMAIYKINNNNNYQKKTEIKLDILYVLTSVFSVRGVFDAFVHSFALNP